MRSNATARRRTCGPPASTPPSDATDWWRVAWPSHSRHCSEYLHETETGHSYLVLEIGAGERRWTDMALALADRIVVVCSAHPGPDELPTDRRSCSASCQRAVTSSAGWQSSTLPTRSVPTVVRRWPTNTGSTGSPTSDRGRSRISTEWHAWCRATPRRWCSVAVAPEASLISACGGRWASSGVEIDTVGGTSIGAAMGVVMAVPIDAQRLVPEVTRNSSKACSTTPCRSSR